MKRMAPMAAIFLWVLLFFDEGILLEFTLKSTKEDQVPADSPSVLANLKGQNGDIRESLKPFPFLPGNSIHDQNSQRTQVRISYNCI